MFKKINFVSLFVSDVNGHVAFYRDILGLPLKQQEEGYAEFDTEGVPLSLLSFDWATNLVSPDEAHPRHFVLSAEVDDVDAAYKTLTQKGVKFLKQPITRDWGQRTTYFRDPDGNVWEIYSMVKKTGDQ